jgi:hypothetical protein
VWNTIKIGNIVGQLRAAWEQIDDADLSRVSPLAHRHVIYPTTRTFTIRQLAIRMSGSGSSNDTARKSFSKI